MNCWLQLVLDFRYWPDGGRPIWAIGHAGADICVGTVSTRQANETVHLLQTQSDLLPEGATHLRCFQSERQNSTNDSKYTTDETTAASTSVANIISMTGKPGASLLVNQLATAAPARKSKCVSHSIKAVHLTYLPLGTLDVAYTATKLDQYHSFIEAPIQLSAVGRGRKRGGFPFLSYEAYGGGRVRLTHDFMRRSWTPIMMSVSVSGAPGRPGGAKIRSPPSATGVVTRAAKNAGAKTAARLIAVS
jgi:hypothetical protein